jgi:lysophospholipase L1-like esterase
VVGRRDEEAGMTSMKCSFAGSQMPERRVRRRAAILVGVVWVVAVAAVVAPSPVRADTPHAQHYYVSLGDSLAASIQPNGDLDHGYVEQLHALLAADDPKLEYVKFGCGGESTASMRFGSQLPTIVSSCGSPVRYRHMYPKGTQLAQAVAFLRAHADKVALITIDIGANDLSRIDADGNLVACLFEPQGCMAQAAGIFENLAAINAELRAAAGPDVPIVGMSYYNVYAPLADPVVDARIDELNGLLHAIYAGAGVPVADVAGAFHNAEQPVAAQLVCAWTWFCTAGDVHPTTNGYGVMAEAFLDVIQP